MSPVEQVRNLNNALLQIHSDIQTAPPDRADELRSQGASVIQERAAAMIALIEQDPGQALALAFSPELLADLAQKFPESAPLLESQGTWQGSFEHWIIDNADLNSHRSVRRLNVDQRALDVHFAGPEPEGLKSGDVLQATGVLAGNILAVSDSNHETIASTRIIHKSGAAMTSRATTTTNAAASTCSNTGVQNTAVLMVTFPGVTMPVTSQAVNDVFFGTSTGHSLDGFWREASYGQASATGGVFGPYALTGSYNCLNMSQVMSDAIAAASTSGVNLGNYTRIFVVMPSLSCGWAGMTQMGCNTLSTPTGTITASSSYVLANYFTTRDDAVELVAHEGGHQMGLDHSGTINAYPTAALGPLSSPGTATEFNDFFSTMGTWTLALYPAQQKAEILNWMAPGANYQVVQSSGTYTIQPIETSPAGLQALKVQRGTGNNAWLWIEYRQPIGNYDSTIGFMNFSGALIHYEDSTTGAHTRVLDFTPSDVGSWYNTVLAPGQTWIDPYTNVSLSVQSATPAGLTVSVNYGSTSCTHANPTVSISPANPSVYAGANVNYTVSVSNNDSSGCPQSTFNLSSSLPSSWTTSFSTNSLALSPGQTGSVTMSKVVPTGTTAASYAVNSSATNGSYTGTGPANCTVMASAPPALAVTTSLSSSTYTLKQTVSATAAVNYGGSPAAGARVTFTMTEPNGSKVTKTVTADSTGKAVWSYKFGPRDLKGTYSCSAQASYNSQTATSNSATFTVQ